MPEGDTLFRTAAGLRPWLVGRPVLAARARVPGPRVEKVPGATVTSVEAQGKNLLIALSNGLVLRTHLRMRGSWHRYRPGEPWRLAPGRAVLVLEVEGSVAVCFDAPVVELFEQRVAPVHPSLGRLGPDLLKPLVDTAECLRRLRAPERADVEIGVALLDQRALAGVGNEIKCETLWQAAVSPFSPVGQLDDETVLRIVETAVGVLAEGAATGRRPRHVYGRAGRPCPRCRTIIRAASQGSDLPRRTSWCPGCQDGTGAAPASYDPPDV